MSLLQFQGDRSHQGWKDSDLSRAVRVMAEVPAQRSSSGFWSISEQTSSQVRSEGLIITHVQPETGTHLRTWAVVLAHSREQAPLTSRYLKRLAYQAEAMYGPRMAGNARSPATSSTSRDS
jgi:hypothetical protein